ncbi:MAG: nucleoside hydrolase [Lachnospiraceae bacterium]|nr:nucleoside hydrolase [Lachnospiraceae bacterium]
MKIPEQKKIRVIIDTDAKNEVDDQFAIVQAVLSESFDLRALIGAHFGEEKSPHSMQDSYEEIENVLSLMGREDVKVLHGGASALTSETLPVISEGAQYIIEEAMREDERHLYIAFLGPLTDMASALLMCPEIATKDLTVIWIGGRDWPAGGWEYNLKNDILAANVILKSQLELWQVPRNVYRMMPVSHAELWTRVRPHGAIGKYLAENVVNFNNEWPSRPREFRILGDSPAVGLMLYPDCGEWEWKPAPELDEHMNYVHNGKHRPIKVYKNIDARFILEDLYAKLQLAAQGE